MSILTCEFDPLIWANFAFEGGAMGEVEAEHLKRCTSCAQIFVEMLAVAASSEAEELEFQSVVPDVMKAIRQPKLRLVSQDEVIPVAAPRRRQHPGLRRSIASGRRHRRKGFVVTLAATALILLGLLPLLRGWWDRAEAQASTAMSSAVATGSTGIGNAASREGFGVSDRAIPNGSHGTPSVGPARMRPGTWEIGIQEPLGIRFDEGSERLMASASITDQASSAEVVRTMEVVKALRVLYSRIPALSDITPSHLDGFTAARDRASEAIGKIPGPL